MKAKSVTVLILALLLSAAGPVQMAEAGRRSGHSRPAPCRARTAPSHRSPNIGGLFAVMAGLTILNAIVDSATANQHVCTYVERQVWVPGYYRERVERRWVPYNRPHFRGNSDGYWTDVVVRDWVPGHYETTRIPSYGCR